MAMEVLELAGPSGKRVEIVKESKWGLLGAKGKLPKAGHLGAPNMQPEVPCMTCTCGTQEL